MTLLKMLKNLFIGFFILFFSLQISKAQTYTVTTLTGNATWEATCGNATALTSGTFVEGIRQLNQGLATNLVFQTGLTGTIDLSARTTPTILCASGKTITGNPGIIITSSITYQDLFTITGSNNIISNLEFRNTVGISAGSGNEIKNCTFTAAVGVTGVGIVVSSSNNIISGNTISKFESGIFIQGGNNTQILNNYIFGNTNFGIKTTASPIVSPNAGPISNSLLIQGNKIGLNSANLIQNHAEDGIFIYGGDAHIIGGCGAGQGNIVVGNGLGNTKQDYGHGIAIWNCTGTGVNAVSIQGNFVGTVTGTEVKDGAGKYYGNGRHGIYVRASQNVKVGGTCPNIVGNNGFGLLSYPSSGIALYVGATANIVDGNFIGTNNSSATASKIGNYQDGITINGSSTNTIQNNTTGNNWQGIGIRFASNGNIVKSNYVGTNLSNANISNGQVGISIENSSLNNIVGGIGVGNIIKNNNSAYRFNVGNDPAAKTGGAGYGVWIVISCNGNSVLGNTISNNGGSGVLIEGLPGGSSPTNIDGSSNNQIGGILTGQGNIISSNGGDGVNVYLKTSLRNTIRGNSISCNTGKGINLNYGASEGNGGLAGPVITTNLLTSTHIEGTAKANSIIDLYYTATTCTRNCSDALKQEGLTYFTSVTANASGAWQYNGTLTGTVTATANNDLVSGAYNTSEFATCAVLCTTPTVSGNNSVCANQAGIIFTSTQNSTWTVIGATITAGAGSNSITVTAGTANFTVTASTGTGCTSSVFNVTVNTNPTATASATSPAICSGKSTAITVTPSGGTTPYTYSWTPAGTLSSGTVQSPTATPTSTTTYSVVVTDNKGCSNSASPATVTVTVNQNPTATASATSPAICNGKSTAITVTPSGGTTPYTYSWTPAGTLSSGTVQSPTATPTTTTTYSVVVTDNKGCSNSASPATVLVTVNQNPTATASATSPAICNGKSTAITVTPSGGTTPYTYSWTPAGTLSSGTVQSPTATPTTTTTYSVVVTDNKGCSNSASPATVLVTVNQNPTATASATSPAICNGKSTAISVTPSGGTTPYTYSWTPTATLSSGTVQSPTATPTTTTTYSVVVTDNKGCSNSASPATVLVTVNQNPTATASATSPAICNGKSTAISVTPSGGTTPYTYSWTPTATLSSGTVQSPTATPTTTTTYSVVVTDNKGCTNSASPATVTVTVNDNPTATASATSPAICNGKSTAISVTPNGGATPYTYSWTPAGTLTSGTVQSPTATPTTTTTYSVVVTDNKGCSNSVSPATVTVTVNDNPTATASATSPAICNGKSTAISVTPNGGTTPYTYSWTPAGTLTSGTVQSPTATPASTTTYTVIVTDNKGCSNSVSPATVTVTVNDNPTATASATSPAICNGKSTAISVTPNGGATPYTYSWTPAGTLSSGTDQSPTATPTSTTTYTVIVTDNKGCSNSVSPATVTVTVNDNPTATASATSPAICNGQSTAISVTPNGGATPYTYSWTPAGTLTSGIVQSPTATPASTTTYTVIVTDNKGCSNSTSPASVTVVVNTKPVVTSPNKGEVCSGTELNYLIASDMQVSYTWDRAAVTGIENLAVTGKSDNPITENLSNTTNNTIVVKYVITAISTSCGSDNFELEVSVNPTPKVTSVTADSTGICGSTSVDLEAQVDGNPADFTFKWSPEESLDNSTIYNPTATPSDTTIYSVEVTSAKGCKNNPLKDTITINVLPNVTFPNLGPDFSTCLTTWFVEGNKLEVGIGTWKSLGNADIELSGDTAINVSGLEFGDNKFVYTVTGTCPSKPVTDTLTIKLVTSDLVVTAVAPNDSLCTSTAADIIALVSGTVAKPLTYNWTSISNGVTTTHKPEVNDSILTVQDYPAGWVEYNVVVIDGKGCVSTNIGRDSLFGVGPQTLIIPNMITPNGDGKNECWVIKDVNEIPIIPGAKLNIYNRWGQAVYMNKDYENGDFCGSILADGIYFYEVHPVCGKDEQKGWLHIISNTDESSNK